MSISTTSILQLYAREKMMWFAKKCTVLSNYHHHSNMDNVLMASRLVLIINKRVPVINLILANFSLVMTEALDWNVSKTLPIVTCNRRLSLFSTYWPHLFTKGYVSTCVLHYSTAYTDCCCNFQKQTSEMFCEKWCAHKSADHSGVPVTDRMHHICYIFIVVHSSWSGWTV